MKSVTHCFLTGLLTVVVLTSIWSCSENDNSSIAGMVIVQGNDTMKSFLMDETEVTNRQFQQFVQSTGYITTAQQDFSLPIPTERGIVDSTIAAGSLVFRATAGPVALDDFSQWWLWLPGTHWAQPNGPGSDISQIMNHPVVHVSFEDVIAYAKWADKRIPTESEWEMAAATSRQHEYAWGNDPAPASTQKANFWQGSFPFHNLNSDGYYGTAPVKSFPPNPYGLYEMSGNVWEWCVSSSGTPIVKGGSFLCNDSYCSGYRISSRMPNDTKSSLNHTGFRLVKDLN